MKNSMLYPLLLLAVWLLAACSEDSYKLYDTSQTDAVFFDYRNAAGDPADSVAYVYNYDIANVHTVELPVTLMGMPADRDRHIDIEAVADSSDMTEGTNYTIEGTVLPAGAVKATVKVNLLRDKDPEIKTRAKRVVLRIKDGTDLRNVGGRTFRINYSDIRPTLRPNWWVTTSKFPVYSFESAQLFFQYFYRYAPAANIDVYNEMMEAYGEYFIKARASKGPIAMYGDFLVKYVLMPLYRDHPELEWQNIPNF